MTLLLVAATSFNGSNKYPSVRERIRRSYVKAISSRSPENPTILRAAHVVDFQRLFGRVNWIWAAANRKISLRTNVSNPRRPIPRWLRFSQFGRYLLISCSRPGDQPSNLQGLWNHEIRPRGPPTGRSTATSRSTTGPSRSPTSPNATSRCRSHPPVELRQQRIAGPLRRPRLGGPSRHGLWARAGPIKGSGCEAMFPAGTAWLCQHLWEHYAFGGERGSRDAGRHSRGPPVLPGHLGRSAGARLASSPPRTCPSSTHTDARRQVPAHVPARPHHENDPRAIPELPRRQPPLRRTPGLRTEIEKALQRLPPMQISPTTGELQEWQQDWQRQPAATMQPLDYGAPFAARRSPARHARVRGRPARDSSGPQRRGSWQGRLPGETPMPASTTGTPRWACWTRTSRNRQPQPLAEFGGDGRVGDRRQPRSHRRRLQMLVQSQTGEIELCPPCPRPGRTGA